MYHICPMPTLARMHISSLMLVLLAVGDNTPLRQELPVSFKERLWLSMGEEDFMELPILFGDPEGRIPLAKAHFIYLKIVVLIS